MDDPDPDLIIPDPAPAQLFDIASDPLEQEDLAGSEPERAARMQSALESWFEEVEAERARIRLHD